MFEAQHVGVSFAILQKTLYAGIRFYLWLHLGVVARELYLVGDGLAQQIHQPMGRHLIPACVYARGKFESECASDILGRSWWSLQH